MTMQIGGIWFRMQQTLVLRGPGPLGPSQVKPGKKDPTYGFLSRPRAGWSYPALVHPALPLCVILEMKHTVDCIGVLDLEFEGLTRGGINTFSAPIPQYKAPGRCV